MAINHIPIDQSKRLGGRLRQLVNSLRDFTELLAELRGIGNQSFDGTDYAHLETQWGIPTGSGADVLFLLNSLGENLETNDSVSNTLGKVNAILNQLG